MTMKKANIEFVEFDAKDVITTSNNIIPSSVSVIWMTQNDYTYYNENNDNVLSREYGLTNPTDFKVSIPTKLYMAFGYTADLDDGTIHAVGGKAELGANDTRVVVNDDASIIAVYDWLTMQQGMYRN